GAPRQAVAPRTLAPNQFVHCGPQTEASVVSTARGDASPGSGRLTSWRPQPWSDADRPHGAFGTLKIAREQAGGRQTPTTGTETRTRADYEPCARTGLSGRLQAEREPT